MNLKFASEITKSLNYEMILRGSEPNLMTYTLYHFQSISFIQVGIIKKRKRL